LDRLDRTADVSSGPEGVTSVVWTAVGAMERSAIALAAAGLVLCGCASKGTTPAHAMREEFALGKRAATQHNATPAGRRYGMLTAPWLGPAITPMSLDCLQSAPEGSGDAFEWYVLLAATGEVRRAVVEPVSPHSDCFREGLLRLTFPVPHSDGYWVGAIMAPK
jgi:hypothetical protein